MRSREAAAESRNLRRRMKKDNFSVWKATINIRLLSSVLAMVNTNNEVVEVFEMDETVMHFVSARLHWTPRPPIQIDCVRIIITILHHYRIQNFFFGIIKLLKSTSGWTISDVFTLSVLRPFRNLSSNTLTLISRKTFSGCPSLRNLQLEGNHIACIDDAALRRLKNLEVITLSNNNLTRISR